MAYTSETRGAAPDRSGVIDDLRERIERIESGVRRRREFLPFGVPEIDGRLQGGGLDRGALHEFAGGGIGVVTGAAPALFVSGILARTKGQVVWCLARPDLFAPALAQAGLDLDRVIFVESDDEDGVLDSFETALRFGGLAAVVGEIVRLPMTTSRRLQLAAESTGTMALCIRRWRRQTEATDFGNPTAAATRWRISTIPSAPLPVPGVGPMRWTLELMRQRGGECAEFEVEACGPDGRIRLSSGGFSSEEDFRLSV